VWLSPQAVKLETAISMMITGFSACDRLLTDVDCGGVPTALLAKFRRGVLNAITVVP
jgi:hypothetical protein